MFCYFMALLASADACAYKGTYNLAHAHVHVRKNNTNYLYNHLYPVAHAHRVVRKGMEKNWFYEYVIGVTSYELCNGYKCRGCVTAIGC